MNKGKLDKGFGGRPKKSVTEKMERVTVFIPALLVPRYPPLRIRELVVSDSLGSAPTGGASKVIPAVEVSTPDVVVIPAVHKASVDLRVALLKANIAGVSTANRIDDIETVLSKPFGDTETSVRTYGLSPLRAKLAKLFNDLMLCEHIDEVMIEKWVRGGIEKASGEF